MSLIQSVLYTEVVVLCPKYEVSFIQRLLVLCPKYRVSFIGGFAITMSF